MIRSPLLGKREKAAALLARGGLLKLLEMVRWGAGSLAVLAYHSVRDIVVSDYPFDEETVSASCQQFDLQMNFVKSNFDVITFKDVMEYREGKIPLPKRPLIITFDDGFADNYQNAFPILRRYRLPATIFLVSGLIGTDEIFWWERVVYWLKHAENFFEIWSQLGHPLPSQMDKTQKFVLRYLKDVEDKERLYILMEMEKKFPVSKTDALFSLMRPLRWDEIAEMSQKGIEFGSHTVTHPLLSKVSEEKLLFELQASKNEIETRIGKEVLALAYPVGGPPDYNESVISVAKQVGYAFGLTYSPVGVNSRSIDDWYRMRRISIERDYSFNRFRSYLFLPALFL